MRAHLKKGSSETIITKNEESGEVVDVQTKHHTYLAATKEQFFIGYVSMLSLFYEDLNGPEIKVYSYLLAHYNFDTTIAIIKTIKEDIAKKIGIKIGTIDNALGGLTRKNLIYPAGKATYKLNPRYAFKGKTSERNELLRSILVLECPTC